MKERCDILKHSSCAMCATKIDQDFTLIYTNNLFYDLIGYSENEVQYKFANHFSVFLGTRNIKKILKSLNGGLSTLTIEHMIISSLDKEIWLHIDIDFQMVQSHQIITFVFFDITKYKMIEYQLKYYTDIKESLFELGNFDVFEYDYETHYIIDYQSKYLFSKPMNKNIDFLDYFIEMKLHSQSIEVFQNSIERVKKNKTKDFCDIYVKDKNDEYRWFRSALIHMNEHDKSLYMHLLTDITVEKEATIQYLHETLFYQAMLSDQEAFGHLDVTDNKILKVGGIWNPYNEIIDKVSYSDLFKEFSNKVVHPEDLKSYWEVMDPENLIDSYYNGIFHLGSEFRRIVEQNRMCWMNLTIHLFKDSISDHIMALIYIKNIDSQKKMNQEVLEHSLDYDALTDLYNKKTAKNLIKDYLKEMRLKELCVIALVDVDNFHHISKEYGTDKANNILIHISQILNQAFRKSDIIGRYDFNQYILLLKNYDYEVNLKIRLDNLMSTLTQEINPSVSLSIGLATVEYGDSYESSFRHADVALFAAKHAGKGCYVFYHEQLLSTEARSEFETRQQHKSKEIVMSFNSLEIDNSNTIQIQQFNMLTGEEGDIAYLVNPHNYDLLCGNQAFYNRLGKTVEECQGKKCYELMHNRTNPCPFCRKANWTEEKYYLYRNYNHMLEQEFLIKNKLIEWHNQETLLAFAIDLSNDKNIVDSIANDTTENNYILNGIHVMQKAESLSVSIHGGLDTIGNFFRAKNVKLWKYNQVDDKYYCQEIWTSHQKYDYYLTENEEKNISDWLCNRKWKHYQIIESREAMLCDSYDLYLIMKKENSDNQRWVEIEEEGLVTAIIQINDITINFQNMTFLESFISFMVSEWRKRAMVDKIIYARDYDDLTGLLNRNSYDMYLKEYCSDNVKTISSICVNIDNLSEINIKNSDAFGDYVLKKVAEFLKRYFHKDSIFRLSGDEFIVLVIDQNVDYILKRIHQIKENIDELDLFTISVGYAWDNVEKNINETIGASVQIMRENKKQYYDSHLLSNVGDYQLEQIQLLKNIENHDYEVWLQPKIDSRKEHIFGAEALIRFRDKEFGILPPVKYIPRLESNGLVRYIDLFVFEETLKILEKWIKLNKEKPLISLNFSRKTILEENIVDNLENIFKCYDVPKEAIEIEILESYTDVGKAPLYEAIKNLRRAGYQMSLDDFGTNYTNLSILADTEINTLKIDKSLIHSLETQSKNKVILRHIVDMCYDLNIQVIAEGVETRQQRDIMVDLGCYLFQGYFYDKPMSIQDFENKYLLETDKKSD